MPAPPETPPFAAAAPSAAAAPRRRFVGAALRSPLAVAAALVGARGAAVAAPVPAPPAPAPAAPRGYRLSAHVERYYDSARY